MTHMKEDTLFLQVGVGRGAKHKQINIGSYVNILKGAKIQQEL